MLCDYVKRWNNVINATLPLLSVRYKGALADELGAHTTDWQNISTRGTHVTDTYTRNTVQKSVGRNGYGIARPTASQSVELAYSF